MGQFFNSSQHLFPAPLLFPLPDLFRPKTERIDSTRRHWDLEITPVAQFFGSDPSSYKLGRAFLRRS